jgi:hypothetical protein
MIGSASTNHRISSVHLSFPFSAHCEKGHNQKIELSNVILKCTGNKSDIKGV